MSKQTTVQRAQTIIDDWRATYLEANGREAQKATYAGGWVMLEGTYLRHRLRDVEGWTANLRDRIRRREMEASPGSETRMQAGWVDRAPPQDIAAIEAGFAALAADDPSPEDETPEPPRTSPAP